MGDLPEAPPKWLCHTCDEICREHLTAPNPFDPTIAIVGCPHCKCAETLEVACQVGDCRQLASGGHPGGHGFRYIWTCWDHRPHDTPKAGRE